MSNIKELTIPDIGTDDSVEVIEILVAVGDEINIDDSIITLESDKASMEIPSTIAGKVKEIKVAIGDKVSKDDLVFLIEQSAEDEKPVAENEANAKSKEQEVQAEVKVEQEKPAQAEQLLEVLIPDIGGAVDVDVIELMVAKGDVVKKEQALITLEGDKATMEIPSPYDGVVDELYIKVGDKVGQGTPVLSIMSKSVAKEETNAQEEKKEVTKENVAAADNNVKTARTPSPSKLPVASEKANKASVYASPGVRRLAREFGVVLSNVSGTGNKGRILKEDIQVYVKENLNKSSATGMPISKAPVIDFRKFGEIELKPLNKIKRLTAENLHRSWLTVPHVTQFDEADITEMDSFRKAQKAQAEKEGYKLTPLAFITKAVANALKKFPQFNSSLDETGENLIYKKYINIGIAVETPAGLVVPVIKDVDKKSISDIAKDMGVISEKARNKKLLPGDMSGASFTISSLGGIGGTAFTPIVNAPEVAILGVSKAKHAPIYDGVEFVPRLMLPLSLSYDHRVIDGAEAARFTNYLGQCLSDIRTLLL